MGPPGLPGKFYTHTTVFYQRQSEFRGAKKKWNEHSILNISYLVERFY